MGPNIFARPPKLTLEERVIGSLEEMLAQEHYVSAIGILTRTRLLEQVHVEAWRKGRIGSLQEALQVGPNKLNRVWQLLAAFVRKSG